MEAKPALQLEATGAPPPAEPPPRRGKLEMQPPGASAAAKTGVHQLRQSRMEDFLRKNAQQEPIAIDSSDSEAELEVESAEDDGGAATGVQDSDALAALRLPAVLPLPRSAVPWFAALPGRLLVPGCPVTSSAATAAQLPRGRLCALRPAPVQFERLTPSDRRAGAAGRPITAMVFDSVGAFLAVAAAGADGAGGPAIKLYDAEDVFGAAAVARAAGAQGSKLVLQGLPEVPMLHAVETGPSPIVSLCWNPGRPGHLASVSRGAATVAYWDMDAAPEAPTLALNRDRDGMVPVPGATAGMSCVSFIYDVNTPAAPAASGGAPSGFPWWDVGEGTPARPRAGVMAAAASKGRHALSPPVAGAAPAAAGCSGNLLAGGDGAGRVRLWDVRAPGRNPAWAVDIKDCIPEGQRARSLAAPGGRVAPRSSRPSGVLGAETEAEAFALRAGGLQHGVAAESMMRSDWGLSDFEVLALVQGGATGAALTAVTAGGAAMAWDMRAVAKRGMVARASPAVLTAWDAAAAVKAAAAVTPACRHPAPASLSAWPFVPTATAVGANGAVTQVPVRVRAGLPHPGSAAWVTVTWSNSWVSVHDAITGSVVRVHRPTEKEDAVTVVGRRVTCEVGGPALGAAAGGGGCGVFLPGLSSPLLAIPQLRALAPDAAPAMPGYTGRTHYRGSLGEPVLASSNPLEPTAVLSFIDLSRPGAHPDAVVASLVMPAPLSAVAPHPAAADHLVVGTSDGQVMLLACDPRAYE